MGRRDVAPETARRGRRGSGSWLWWLLAVVIGVQQLEGHVLQPFLMGKAVSVHPLAVVLAVLGLLAMASLRYALRLPVRAPYGLDDMALRRRAMSAPETRAPEPIMAILSTPVVRRPRDNAPR